MKRKYRENDWSTIVSRGGVFSLIWWSLTDGIASSLWVGVPAVLFAVITSVALLPSAHFVWYEFLKFMPFFLTRSLLGGADVAWRAFHPGMLIDPVIIKYPLRLPPGLPQVFMANTVSLLPGTLSATLNRSMLKVHVLDKQKDILAELDAVEISVARMFGTSIKSGGGE